LRGDLASGQLRLTPDVPFRIESAEL
jgi:hypothetical protein